MTRVALRGLWGRKLRSVLTAVAIVLGVALVAGTLVLTDSIDKAFDNIFTDSRQGSSVVISGKSAFDLTDDSGATAPPLDDSLLQTVESQPDVAEAEGSVSGNAQIIGDDGKAIVYGGAPNLGFSIANGDSRFNPLSLVEGSWPQGKEVVIDASTADKEGFKVGDTVGVQGRGPVENFGISGLVKFGSVSTIGGATLVGLDLPTAQRIFAREGQLDEIAVAAKPGVSDTQVADELRTVLPADAQVRTAAQQAKNDAEDTDEFISFLRTFLLAFGGIALFVGAFVIANSLSITIAQRTRELATLRTVGASRRQVLRSILIESLVVGVFASVVGLFLGLGLAKGLFWLFDAVGFTLPNSGLIFETRTIVVALVVGIIVTVGASLRPAIRATRVPPIAAVREGATLPESRFARFRTPAALVLAAIGFGLVIYGLFGGGGTSTVLLSMGAGALLVFIGVALFASKLVPGLATVLGWPSARVGGASGRLARGNAKRNPQRTASTAAALMIGLALVTLVAVLGQGIRSSFTGAVDKIFVSDYAITAENNFSPIPTDAADAAAQAPGVEAVASVRAGQALVFGDVHNVTAVTPDAGQALNLDWKDGSQAVFGALGENGAFVDDDFADDHNLTIGSPVKITAPSGTVVPLVVKGIFDPPAGGSPFGAVTFSAATFDKNYDQPENLYSFVKMSGGVTDANTQALDNALAEFPNAKGQTRDEFKDNQVGFLNNILNILYLLLALSVIVSLFGIINTLVLTVFERTREIGTLRAVGMTRRQVRRMIRYESVITALIGAVLGIVLGVVLAALLTVRVDFIKFDVPVGQIIGFAVAAIIVGIVAAILPARRAAKLNVLRALQYE
ncbi:MAG TPA: FtsX-like permease family protein [Gaiellaceae bacterium]|nr:FtsX-like permease family protein [Gaiellaceae bacterium]